MKVSNLRSRAGMMLVEQAANTGWNFLFGTLVARWGGVRIFGMFALVMAVYFILTAAIGAMSIGIISVDAARLKKSRNTYLAHARKSAEKVAGIAAIAGSIVICGLATTFPSDHKSLIAVMGIIYLGANILSDIRRRTLALGDHVMLLTVASALRTGGLCIFAALAYFLAPEDMRVPIVVFAALLISLCYVLILGRHGKTAKSRDYRLPAITLARQTKFGGWGFAASLVMSSLDQGLMIYAGALGLTTVAAEMRSGSYLFNLMNPVMLVFDVMMPSVIFRFLGRDMRLHRVGMVVLAGAIISAGTAGCLSLLNAKLWLPFLGPDYVPFEYISYWVGIYFACMTTRSFIMQFLKTRAAQAAFRSSALGTACGIAVAAMSTPFGALAICKAMVCSGIVQVLANGYTLVRVCLKAEKARA